MRLKGAKKLIRKARRLQDLRSIRGDLMEAAIHIKSKIRRYPPPTEANMPRPGQSFYERGYGTRYASLAGNISPGSKTSEDLKKRWGIERRRSGFTVVIGNNASYAPFVHSEEKQAYFHGNRGWKTDKTVLEQEKDGVLRDLQVTIRRKLAK